METSKDDGADRRSGVPVVKPATKSVELTSAKNATRRGIAAEQMHAAFEAAVATRATISQRGVNSGTYFPNREPAVHEFCRSKLLVHRPTAIGRCNGIPMYRREYVRRPTVLVAEIGAKWWEIKSLTEMMAVVGVKDLASN